MRRNKRDGAKAEHNAAVAATDQRRGRARIKEERGALAASLEAATAVAKLRVDHAAKAPRSLRCEEDQPQSTNQPWPRSTSRWRPRGTRTPCRPPRSRA